MQKKIKCVSPETRFLRILQKLVLFLKRLPSPDLDLHYICHQLKLLQVKARTKLQLSYILIKYITRLFSSLINTEWETCRSFLSASQRGLEDRESGVCSQRFMLLQPIAWQNIKHNTREGFWFYVKFRFFTVCETWFQVCLIWIRSETYDVNKTMKLLVAKQSWNTMLVRTVDPEVTIVWNALTVTYKIVNILSELLK
jgi:hypothetical protein